VDNDQILELADEDMSVVAAFWRADEVLRQAVQGISDLIVMPGIINIDFADIKNLLTKSGKTYVSKSRINSTLGKSCSKFAIVSIEILRR